MLEPSARRRRRFALLAVLLGIGAALSIVELAMHLSLPPNWAESQIGPDTPEVAARWVGDPFLPFVGARSTTYEFDFPIDSGPTHVVVRNNRDGFRSHDLPTEKSTEDYFIIALGESTTWGAIAPTNAETWPERLAAKLQERYPTRRVRAFNFGVQNANDAYSVVSLALHGAAIQPDLVIAYHGYNATASSMATSYRFDHTHVFRDIDLHHSWHGWLVSLPPFLRGSYSLVWLASQLDEAIGARRLSFYIGDGSDLIVPATDEWPQRLRRNWMTLKSIDSIARGHGGRALFSTFQFYQGDDPLYAAINQSLRAYFTEEKLDYVDLDARLPDGDRSLQFDACHFTHLGRERVAEIFFEDIVRRGWLEPDGRS